VALLEVEYFAGQQQPCLGGSESQRNEQTQWRRFCRPSCDERKRRIMTDKTISNNLETVSILLWNPEISAVPTAVRSFLVLEQAARLSELSATLLAPRQEWAISKDKPLKRCVID
jgi:hypothetical protein